MVVFQDFATKWPLVFPAPDQLTVRIIKLLTEQVVPFFGVPDALFSDRGTHLLSHLMFDVCKLLGIRKLKPTAYFLQCDGMVERFNRTLKAMIRKHVPALVPVLARLTLGLSQHSSRFNWGEAVLSFVRYGLPVSYRSSFVTAVLTATS